MRRLNSPIVVHGYMIQKGVIKNNNNMNRYSPLMDICNDMKLDLVKLN